MKMIERRFDVNHTKTRFLCVFNNCAVVTVAILTQPCAERINHHIL